MSSPGCRHSTGSTPAYRSSRGRPDPASARWVYAGAFPLGTGASAAGGLGDADGHSRRRDTGLSPECRLRRCASPKASWEDYRADAAMGVRAGVIWQSGRGMGRRHTNWSTRPGRSNWARRIPGASFAATAGRPLPGTSPLRRDLHQSDASVSPACDPGRATPSQPGETGSCCIWNGGVAGDELCGDPTVGHPTLSA